MDILAAMRQEEAKWEKEVSAAQQQLDNVRAAIKLLGGMNGSGKTTASSSVKTTGGMNSSGKTTGNTKRVMSAAARAKMAKAQKERWAKFRAAKAKGKN
jgi:predicted ATPase